MKSRLIRSLLLLTLLRSNLLAAPLDNWHWRTPLPTGGDQRLYGLRVAWVGNCFLALGFNGIILSSSNGVDWVERHSGGSIADTIADVAFGNGMFVAAGWDGTIRTSSDLTSWTSKTVATNASFKGVTFGNDLFVTVSCCGGVWTSADAVNWKQAGGTTPSGLTAIAHGNGLFAVTTCTGSVWTSTDGNAWTLRSPVTYEWLRSIVYAKDMFVAVGGNDSSLPSILTSADGTNWIPRPSGILSPFYGLTYGGGYFLASTGDQLARSTDGITWTEFDPQIGGEPPLGQTSIAWGNRTFVATAGSRIMQSDQLINVELGRDAQLVISGVEGNSYRIEATSDINTAAGWQLLETISLTNSRCLWRDNSVNLPNKRFYRAVLVP